MTETIQSVERCGGNLSADKLCIASLRVCFKSRTNERAMQHSLIREVMLHKFELGHNAAEATKNICCAKVAGPVNHSTITRWFKKFHSGCKNLDDQTKLGRLKTKNSRDVLPAIEAILVSSTGSIR